MRSVEDENWSSAEESSGDYGEETFEFDWYLPNFESETRERIDTEIFEGKTKCEPTGRQTLFCEEYVALLAKTYRPAATDEFTSDIPDRGFSQMTDGKFEKVTKPGSGFLVDGQLKVHVKLEVLEYIESGESSVGRPMSLSQDSTGFVGLENQGATCYLNSFIQSLYHVPYLRKAVYQMDTSQDSTDNPTITLALQRLFYRMQFEDKSVDTKELTKSFGWDSGEVFTQHDAQELSRIFIDTLETKMKGTKLDGLIEKMYRGTELSVIECLNVKQSSTMKQTFYGMLLDEEKNLTYKDLSLNVKGCPSTLHSLRKYCEEEMLTGADQYDAGETHGKQDAKKYVKFGELPPVLQLHLKRFELRQTRFGYAYEKVNDFYKFPTKIKLDEFLQQPDPNGVKQTYYLHGVLVHSGGINSGHYYAFIRPGMENKWYKFNDDVVSRGQAINNNYGGTAKYGYEKCSNAYMLIYIRKKDRHMYLEPCAKADIPKELSERFEQEKLDAERREREKEELRWLTDVKVVIDADIFKNTANDLCSTPPRTIKVRRDYELQSIREVLEKEVGIPAGKQRIWKWIKRKNKTYRVNSHPISIAKETRKIQNFTSFDTIYVEEVENGFEDYPKDTYLLFLKFYDPTVTPPLKIIEKLHAKKTQTIEEISEHVRKTLGIESEVGLDAWEEVHMKSICLQKNSSTLESAEFRSGDVLIFQKVLPEAESEALKYPTAPDYFDFLARRTFVPFRPRNDMEDDSKEFTLEMCNDSEYDEVLNILGARLNVKPNYIRLSKAYYGPPEVIDGSRSPSLQAMLGRSNILLYDILEVDVESVKDKREIVVTFRDQHLKLDKSRTLFIPKNGSVSDVIDAYKAAEEIEYETEHKKLRLVGVRGNKLCATLLDDAIVPPTSHSHTIEWLLEEISDDEVNAGEKDSTIVIGKYIRRESFHGHEVKWQPYPFHFTFKKGETAAVAKKRIQEKLDLPDAEWDKLSLASFWTSHHNIDSKISNLADDDVISKMFRNSDFQYLGLGFDAKKKSKELKITK